MHHWYVFNLMLSICFYNICQSSFFRGSLQLYNEYEWENPSELPLLACLPPRELCMCPQADSSSLGAARRDYFSALILTVCIWDYSIGYRARERLGSKQYLMVETGIARQSSRDYNCLVPIDIRISNKSTFSGGYFEILAAISLEMFHSEIGSLTPQPTVILTTSFSSSPARSR